MKKSLDISVKSEIHNMLESEAKQIKIKERQFSLFAYNTIFDDKKKTELNLEISQERALFPTMNPNLFGGLPSIFSCKPRLRVSLKPGDVIFCFPKKPKRSNNMEKYFRFKGQKIPARCITLIMIVIKKVSFQHAYDLLRFKACNIKREIIDNNDFEYFTFSPDLKQSGDITARFKDGAWEYVGNDSDSHYNDEVSIKSLNDRDCPYKNYLDENHEPFPVKGCNKLNCVLYKNEICKMKSGNWKYDILFKYGLLGSLKKSIPLEVRSFFLGSKGWTLKEFTKRIGVDNCEKNLEKNARWYSPAVLNSKGSEILDDLRDNYNIK
jgi:hypothetical protein